MPDSLESQGGATVPEEQHCAGTAATGEPCGTPAHLLRLDADTGESWCFAHDPTMTEERSLAARKGGLRTGAKARRFAYLAPDGLPELRTPEDARDFAKLIGRSAATGRLNSAAAGVALKAVEAFLRSLEAIEVAERLAQLERLMTRATEDREAERRARVNRPDYPDPIGTKP